MAATDPANEALTVIRLEGLSRETFENQDSMIFVASGTTLQPVFWIARPGPLNFLVIAAFSTPTTITQGQLVIGNLATLRVVAPTEIRGKLTPADLD